MNSPERRYAPDSLTDRIVRWIGAGPLGLVLIVIAIASLLGAAVIAIGLAIGFAR